mmetsp:Transcript_28313/g.39117  ORF Transcript_28313/g.39117 Transcript_28313/m.39117 type:complete len:328 (+) Transcript_28313:145-1128(+)|eukprot:CAMPEP_0196596952 /NCGR_PEP_ID=MMETSP1081-20130531/88739_1 /TAXON_ID=36882 /ORGANISM="Pyramimonas amylifera, Strain CCMP720" /LENGTH=327 /DNA_ID=CAMNT_0041922167 /DNA_START=136 /DNA_END=1119 /DNA_ORIENTATION=+
MDNIKSDPALDVPAVDVRPSIDASEVHILLVDDERLSRLVVRNLLEKCLFKVTPCDSGLKAQEIVEQGTRGAPFPYNLLLLDVVMPTVSGIQILKQVRASPLLAGVSVVMMSAHENAGTVFDCIRRGADDYLLKPVSAKEVNHLWQHVWRRRKNNRVLNYSENEETDSEGIECMKSDKGQSTVAVNAALATQTNTSPGAVCEVGDQVMGGVEAQLETECAPKTRPRQQFVKEEDEFLMSEEGSDLYTAEEMRMHCMSQIEKYKKVVMLIDTFPELFPGPKKKMKGSVELSGKMTAVHVDDEKEFIVDSDQKDTQELENQAGNLHLKP